MDKEKSLLQDLLTTIYHSHNKNLRAKVEEGELIKIEDDGGADDMTSMSIDDLMTLKDELDETVSIQSSKLVRALSKQKDHLDSINQNCEVVSAILQAYSSKKTKGPLAPNAFSLTPPEDLTDQAAFAEWNKSFKSLLRLSQPLPSVWRQRIWLAQARFYFGDKGIDVDKARTRLFCPELTDADKELDYQIVKDLHRTTYIGGVIEQQKLKRVLLAYARYNPTCGYCQGFNIIAAFLMEVFSDDMEILKTFIYIIDAVLPPLYHSGNLEGIQTELKVVNELMKRQNKRIYSHLIMLREISMRENGHEPPLCNPYNMQWLLTLFGSSLPKASILRIWDGLFLDGNEILIRATIAVWKFFESDILATQTTDQFYQTMNGALETMQKGIKIPEYELVTAIYSMGPFPLADLDGLREKYNREFAVPTNNDTTATTEEWSTLGQWLPRFSLRLPRSNSIHVPKEVRSSDDAVSCLVNLTKDT